MTSTPSHPKLDALESAARGKGRLSVAIAYPCSTDALAAALAAYAAKHGMANACRVVLNSNEFIFVN